MIYVLDTNVIIRYLSKDENVKNHFRQAAFDGSKLLIPRAVDYEVCRGLKMSSAKRKTIVYTNMTSPAPTGQCEIVDMGENVWELSKQIYVNLYQKGFTVGEIDILIAAFCLHHNYPLVTSNTKDFTNIKGLNLINWQKSQSF